MPVFDPIKKEGCSSKYYFNFYLLVARFSFNLRLRTDLIND